MSIDPEVPSASEATTPVAQAYVHLKPFTIAPSQFETLYEVSRSTAIGAAQNVYGPGHIVEIRTEEGSWKVWATVFAAGLGTYDAVSKYPDFRLGVRALCDDAKMYGADVCGTIISKSGATPNQRFSIQRRLMTPGSVYKLLRELDAFERDRSTLTPHQARERVSAIERRIRGLKYELPPGDIAQLRSLIESRNLPIPLDAFEIIAPIVAIDEKRRLAMSAYDDDAEDLAFHQTVDPLRQGHKVSGRLVKLGTYELHEDEAVKKE